MAASDSVIAFSLPDGTLTLYDGAAASLAIAFIQTEWNWTEETTPWTEARSRNVHHTTPVARVTGSGNVTGSFMCLCSSLLGVSATIYEWMNFSGGASGLTSTGLGDKKMLRAVLTQNASTAGGASQTATFAYCIFTNVKIEPGGADGLCTLSADFTDLENKPTIA